MSPPPGGLFYAQSMRMSIHLSIGGRMNWTEEIDYYGELGARALEKAEAQRLIEEWLG